MRDQEKGVQKEGAQISGRTEGPYGSDGSDIDTRVQDNKNRAILENSANGLDSVQVRGGQNGRNDRGIGSIDMDSKNGVIRLGDMDNSTMEVTEEGRDNAAADDLKNTRTATAEIPDSTREAIDAGDTQLLSHSDAVSSQHDADEGEQPAAAEVDSEETDYEDGLTQEEEDNDIGRTGTSTAHRPTY